MQRKKFFRFYSVESLSKYLGFEPSFLLTTRDNLSKHYRYYPNAVVKGKRRPMYNPDKLLRSVLKRVDKQILDRYAFPKNFFGGIKGKSVKDNANVHIKKLVLVNIDIQDFFPSITPERVESVFCSIGMASEPAKLLSLLTTVKKPKPHLPQGFNTSPKIAALVLLSFDRRLHLLKKKYGWDFTYWVDDISISGNFPVHKFKNTIIKMLNEEGFKVNPRKFAENGVAKNNQKQVVTGLIVNQKTNIQKAKRKEIELALYFLNRYGVVDYLHRKNLGFGKVAISRLRASIKGRIDYVRGVNPVLGKKYLDGFNKIQWRV